MSNSLPSFETFSIDVPDVRDFRTKFIYNFYSPDEGTNAFGTIPKTLVQRNGATLDSGFFDFVSRRIPRFVKLTWTPVRLFSPDQNVSDSLRNRIKFLVPNNANIIGKNLDKIIDESSFSSKGFSAVDLSGQGIDTKIFQLVSGSAVILNDEKHALERATNQTLARTTNALTSDSVTYQFLTKYLVRPNEDNVFFFEKNAQQIATNLADKIKDALVSVQLNNKFVSSMLIDQIASAYSVFSDQFTSSQPIATSTQQVARQAAKRAFTSDDYKTFGTPIVLSTLESNQTILSNIDMVGYVIDKHEVLADGTVIKLDSIVLEDPTASSTIDIEVSYYKRYVYTIRSIALLTLPSIIDDTGELVIAKFLLGSRASHPLVVECVDNTPPPSPADLDFMWDYESEKLNVTWAFPIHPQRDIVKFQVFRRKTIYEPFQLVLVVDFDESEVRAPFSEIPSPELVVKGSNPVLRFIDPDFDRDSKFIYAVCSLDAHGLTSNYSEQFEVSFDRFANRLVTRLASKPGAPKPYPNMQLIADPFLESIVDQGHTRMSIIFDPDHHVLLDTRGRDQGLVTLTDVGSYRLQFINTDLQQQQDVNIYVDDHRTAAGRTKIVQKV